jgi:hypothetical protein
MKYLCWRGFPEKLWDVRAGMTLEPRNKHGVAQRGVNAQNFRVTFRLKGRCWVNCWCARGREAVYMRAWYSSVKSQAFLS